MPLCFYDNASMFMIPSLKGAVGDISLMLWILIHVRCNELQRGVQYISLGQVTYVMGMRPFLVPVCKQLLRAVLEYVS